jgi:hypothetical protein
VALQLGDEVLYKVSKLELREGFAAVSKLKIDKKQPLATSGGDSKNFLASPSGCRMWHLSLSVAHF